MKLLTLNNICFLKGCRTLSPSDPYLHLADCITITFKLQKRDTKNNMITQHQLSDPILCPVKVWANIVHRIHSLPTSSKHTTVNSFLLPTNKIPCSWDLNS